MKENLATTNDLCERFGVCRVTIDRLKKRGMPYIKKGRNVYFVMDDVLLWIGNNYEIKKFNYGEDDEENPVN